MAIEHITDKLVKTLKPAEKRDVITYDDEIKGLGIRVTKNGAKSFVLNYSVNGRERRLTIGQYPAWSVLAAREQARKLKQQVDQGIDPQAMKDEERKALTVKELWLEYKKRHLPSFAKRAQGDVINMFDKYILPKLGSARLKDMTGAQIDDLHKYITQAGGKTRANRVLEVLRGTINKGIRWGYCEKNPATGFKRNAEEPKDRYLSPVELSVLFEKLKSMENKKAANIIRMLILTGARLGEVLNAEWSQFDMVRGIWTKPSSHTKQKRKHVVPISPEVIDLLGEIRRQTNSPLYLFPNNEEAPMRDIKRPWAWLLKETKIANLRVHDLRHTYASLLISDGESLAVIGKLLGHSNHQTTMRYAHLMDNPLRVATGKIAKAISGVK